jgi:hypothetical protein
MLTKENLNQLNWIECNLPWKFRFSPDLYPKYPSDIIKQKIKEKFPEWEALEQKQTILLGWWFSYCNENKISMVLQDHEDNLDISKLEGFQSLKTTRLTYGQMSIDINKFSETIPELIDYNQQYNDFKIKENRLSFCGQKLNVCGTIIELDDGTLELLGSINCLGGVCDDCSFEGGIIKRYARIIELWHLKK